MREAIYESAGIMTSADKNLFQRHSAVYRRNHESARKAHRFASGGARHHSVTEKSKLAGEVEELETTPQV